MILLLFWAGEWKETAGWLGITTKERVDKLLKNKNIFGNISVILSGRKGARMDYKPPITEARAMKKYLEKSGWQSKIYIEEKSLDTIGNAYFSKQIIDKNGWRKILVITSDYHMKRTRWIFRKIFNKKYNIKFFSAPSVKFNEKQGKEKQSFAFTKKIWKEMVGKNFSLVNHPFYSKTPVAKKIW